MLAELTQEEIRDIIANNNIGRIGCTDGEYVYITPVKYIYEYDAVLCHSFQGMKIDMMRMHPTVCFQIDEIKDISNWKTVVANGIYEEITDNEEIGLVEAKFHDHNLLNKTRFSTPPPDAEHNISKKEPKGSSSIYYRIRFTSATGRLEKKIS